MLIFRGLPGTDDPYVKIDNFNHRTSLLLETANEWSKYYIKPVTINAIDNGKHGKDNTVFSFHGSSMAWDFGVAGSSQSDFESLTKWLRMRLPTEYEVILESDHIHVEWDTKRGR